MYVQVWDTRPSRPIRMILNHSLRLPPPLEKTSKDGWIDYGYFNNTMHCILLSIVISTREQTTPLTRFILPCSSNLRIIDLLLVDFSKNSYLSCKSQGTERLAQVLPQGTNIDKHQRL